MRIALAHPYSWPDVRRGGERYLDDLAWYLASEGFEVHVLTGTAGAGSTEARPDGVAVHRFHHIAPVRLARTGITPLDSFGLRLLPFLTRRRFDLVHALTPTAALAARLTGHPAVFTVLGHPTPDQFGLRPGDRRLMTSAIRRASAVTALSRSSADQVRDLLGRDPRVLPPGVRLDRFPADTAARTGPPRLLFSAFVGDQRKGLDIALAAFGRVLCRYPDARLALSGDGDHRWALDHLGADAERIMAGVDLLGAGTLDEVPGRYRSATVTLLPARYEAFGLALVESLASGTPAVCSATGGPPEILDDPRIGRAVPHGDVGAVADAIEAMIEAAAEPETPARCVAHAKRWGWVESVGPRHVELYRELVASR